MYRARFSIESSCRGSMRGPTIKMFLILFLAAAVAGCAPKIKLYPDATDPLREFTISGTGKEKVLMIPVTGILSDKSRGTITSRPSLVQEVVAQLELAEKDKAVKAVVLKINSPGGSVSASAVFTGSRILLSLAAGCRLVLEDIDMLFSTSILVTSVGMVCVYMP